MAISDQKYPRLGSLLRDWRGQRTQNAARLEFNVSWTTYDNWESGRTLPRPRDLTHIAHVTAQPLEALQELVAEDRAEYAGNAR